MPRLLKDVVVTSHPILTAPNGDSFYVEVSRSNGHYDCVLKMARSGNPANSLPVATAKGKTIREAENACYNRAIDRCPQFPKPPYLKRGTAVRAAAGSSRKS